MKRVILASVAFVTLSFFSGCAGIFPTVSEPTSSSSSMLAMEVAKKDTTEKSGVRILANAAWAAEVPYVVDARGKVVPFKEVETIVGANTIFYAENLKAGEYKLVGFWHVYIDYGLKKRSGIKSVKYAPYEKLPYTKKQLFKLKTPVVIQLPANKMATLGSYVIDYKYKEGAAGRSDGRWLIRPESFEFVNLNPNDNKVLRIMKPWATPAWKKWNEKNSEQPL